MSILEISNLSLSFGGVKALQDVSFQVPENTVTTIIGPNGAGKTTVIDAITGLVPASGSVNKSGVELLGKKVHQIARRGIGRTFQTASVFEELSVLQNLDIAAGAGRSVWTMLRRRHGVLPAIEQALHTIGLTKLADQPAGILAHGQKQWLEIGMLLMQKPRLLLVDEPTAGMNPEERADIGERLRKLRDDLGLTILLIEHHMQLAIGLADRVLALNFGRPIALGPPDEVQSHPEVVKAYLGDG